MTLTTQALADRVFASALGAIDILAMHLGDRLGFYRALAERPATSAQLAEAAGTDERYTREWLEQQAASGVLEADLGGDEPVFSLPAAHLPVLVEPTDPAYLAPLARMIATAGVKMPELLRVYREGGGVSWDSFGPGMRESQADMNRPFFEHELAGVFAGLGRAHAVLSRPGARVADVGCGAGWSTVHLALAYPGATFTGFDPDAPAIEQARRNARDAGVEGRVGFTTERIGDDERFDAVLAFECIHDMARPVEVLAAMRTALEPDGVGIVMDEAVGEAFAGPADEVERLMYGFSLLVCLPDGRSSEPSAATGTVMRPAVLRRYALDAGFSGCEPVAEAGFFRFYELTP